MGHLVQTKEIILMGELEKIRDEESRVKKVYDDKQNRVEEFEKSIKKKNSILAERKTATDIPFYQRFQSREELLNNKKR